MMLTRGLLVDLRQANALYGLNKKGAEQAINTALALYDRVEALEKEKAVQFKRSKCEMREAENMVVMANSIIEWMESALDGNAVSEFAESFPPVMKAADVMRELKALKEG